MNSADRVVSNTRNTIADCREYCMTSSTGSKSPIEYDSNQHDELEIQTRHADVPMSSAVPGAC